MENKMQKYGFVYIWFDKKRKMYYIGSHWGTEDDGYICSSNWMRNSYNRNPQNFKRRIVKRIFTNRIDLLKEEEKWLFLIKTDKMVNSNKSLESRKNVRYYNITKTIKNPWHMTEEGIKTVGEKISAAKKGKSTGPCSPEKAAKISEAKKSKNRKFTDEHKAKLRAAKLGKKLSPEHRAKVIKTLKYVNV
jgi:hypothetical protein